MLHVITGLSAGGAEMMLVRLAERLRSEFDQHVISLTDKGAAAELLEQLGVPVLALGLRSSRPNPLLVFRLISAIRSLRPDLVQTWLYHADLLGGLATRVLGDTAVLWNVRSNNLPEGTIKHRTRWVVALCAKLSRVVPSRIVCCAHAAVATHTALGYDPRRLVVIPNGFDLERLKPDLSKRTEVRIELGIGMDTPLIGLIARYDPIKNHRGFFQAAALLHQVRPHVRFILAGRGVEASNPEIMSAVRLGGLEKVVHLLGERRDIYRLHCALDIASSTSWGEAFPNILGEAMACGIPCVAVDAGDAASIVGNTGRIVPRDDPSMLADAWASVLDLPAERRRAMGELARSRIAEYFEIGAIARQYADLYRTFGTHRRLQT